MAGVLTGVLLAGVLVLVSKLPSFFFNTSLSCGGSIDIPLLLTSVVFVFLFPPPFVFLSFVLSNCCLTVNGKISFISGGGSEGRIPPIAPFAEEGALLCPVPL